MEPGRKRVSPHEGKSCDNVQKCSDGGQQGIYLEPVVGSLGVAVIFIISVHENKQYQLNGQYRKFEVYIVALIE